MRRNRKEGSRKEREVSKQYLREGRREGNWERRRRNKSEGGKETFSTSFPH